MSIAKGCGEMSPSLCAAARSRAETRAWSAWAIQTISSESVRSADTHLLRLDLPVLRDAGIDVYLKDESIHPSGSLKHRLARSLFLYAICNGWIGPDTPIVEASSGSTAVSEAYFARLLGLRFIAVVPETTSPDKLRAITFWGGETIKVPARDVYARAEGLAATLGGHYMDQFTYAERATDWRGNNNIAESIFRQMSTERHPMPRFVVVGAGTGGTSATIGRYMRYIAPADTDAELVVADPQGSVFAEYHRTRDPALTSAQLSVIEGIGRPRVERSFMPDVIDRVATVDDAASLAAMHVTSGLLGKRVGGSTGTNMVVVFEVIQELLDRGAEGSVVTLLCDPGERYADTYYNPEWLAARDLDVPGMIDQLHARFAFLPAMAAL